MGIQGFSGQGRSLLVLAVRFRRSPTGFVGHKPIPLPLRTTTGGPLLFQIPLSVSSARAKTRFLSFERKKIGEFRLLRSDPLEVFRPPCLAPSSLRCCQLPVSCQRRPPELYSRPQSLGCGLPGSMRNPRAGDEGALSEVLNFATPASGRRKLWVAGRAHQLITPFPFQSFRRWL